MPNGSLRWSGLVFLACLCLTVLLWATRGWIWLGVPPINPERPPFSDTMAHIGTAVNCAHGHGEWHGRVCFVPDIDAVPRAQTYEPWLTLYRLGIDSETDVLLIAVAMVFLFYLALCAAFRPASPREAVLVLALLFTPAVQLGVERGNFDLLIAAMLCLAGALLAGRRSGSAIAGIATLSLTTMLKLYTGLSAALAWLVTRAPLRWTLPSAVGAVVLAVAVVGPRELRVLGQGAPEGETRFSTGARWLFEHAGSATGCAAMVAALALAVLVWHAIGRERNAPFAAWPRRTALFQIAFLTAVPLFLLKNSYDYRFVLWLPCLALPLAWLRPRLPAVPRTPTRHVALGIFVLFFVATGTELPLTWLDRLGDAAAAKAIAGTLVLAKQFATWLLAAALAAVFMRSLPGALASHARALGLLGTAARRAD